MICDGAANEKTEVPLPSKAMWLLTEEQVPTVDENVTSKLLYSVAPSEKGEVYETGSRDGLENATSVCDQLAKQDTIGWTPAIFVPVGKVTGTVGATVGATDEEVWLVMFGIDVTFVGAKVVRLPEVALVVFGIV